MDEKQNRRAFLKNTIAAGAGFAVGCGFLSGCAACSGKKGKSAPGAGRDYSHLAYCGLDCSACDVFIATRDNNEKLKAKTAKEWSELYGSYLKRELKSTDTNCRGCKTEDSLFIGCLNCPIRKCCREEKLETCAICKGYETCELLNGFFTVPSHKQARENLERIRKKS
jgi:hypothetical protein